jgi:hypothetical protein
MEREFDREIYLNKEKYDAAVEEETKLKNELISKRVKDIKDGMDYNERQWRHFRNFLRMEIRIAIAKNDGVNDEGLELMNGLAEEFFDKFLVSVGARLAPGVNIETHAELTLRGDGLL